MTTTTATTPETTGAAALAPPIATTRRPARTGGGWRIIAAKELADSLQSARFLVLFTLVGLAGLASVHSAGSELRRAASNTSEVPSIFLALFTLSPDRIPSFVAFVSFLAPLLGIAVGFDAIASERSQRTLARLVSQPVHRDDVINGKLAGGLAAVGLALVVTVAVVTGWGIVRLGLVPTGEDVARLAAFTVALLLYVGLWLALAVLASVLFRRAATAALAVLALWLVSVVFWSLLAGVAAGALRPADDQANQDAALANARLEYALGRVAPNQVFEEVASATLNPLVRSTGIVAVDQIDRAVPAALAFDQSVLVVWPQLVALCTALVVVVCAAYLAFLRQELRA